MAPDGGVTLDAVQTFLWNPPGVESVMRPGMSAKMNQLVTAFRNMFVSMGQATAR